MFSRFRVGSVAVEVRSKLDGLIMLSKVYLQQYPMYSFCFV